MHLNVDLTKVLTIIAIFNHTLDYNENDTQTFGLIQDFSQLLFLLVSATFVLRTMQPSDNQQLFRSLLLIFCICSYMCSWVMWLFAIVALGCDWCCFHGCLLCCDTSRWASSSLPLQTCVGISGDIPPVLPGWRSRQNISTPPPGVLPVRCTTSWLLSTSRVIQNNRRVFESQ